MAQPFDIVGYDFRASLNCPACILSVLPTAEGGTFAGWSDKSTPPMPVEENLSEIAAAFGIDRSDERSFDSGDFPKVVFRDQADEEDRCEMCGVPVLY